MPKIRCAITRNSNFCKLVFHTLQRIVAQKKNLYWERIKNVILVHSYIIKYMYILSALFFVLVQINYNLLYEINTEALYI